MQKNVWQRLGNYRLPLIIALLLHSALIITMISRFEAKPYKTMSLATAPQKTIVKAHAVSAVQVQKQEARVAQIAKEKAQAKARIAAQKRKQRLARIMALKRQAEKVKAAKLRVLALKAAKLKAAQLKAAQILAAKRKAVKLQAEEKKALALKKAKVLAVAKATQLKQKKLAKLKVLEKKLQQQLLDQQIKADQQRIARVHAQALAAEINQYKSKILQTISQFWLVPNGVNKKISCLLLIHIAPGGVVLDVQVLRSSGNQALDRSAITAVYRASPLPVPTDPAVFDQFRQLRLMVKPETVLS